MTNRRTVSIHRSLFSHLALLAAGAVALFSAGYAYYGVRPAATAIAESKFEDAVVAVHGSMERLFQPVERLIGMARHWAMTPGFTTDDPTTFNSLFMPLLRLEPAVTSVVAGTSAGRGWLLLQLPDGAWRNRLTDVAVRGLTQRFIEWRDSGGRREYSEIVNYDPRSRPWFRIAAMGAADRVHWTEPYTFFTTGDPGVTASIRLDQPDGETLVVGFDVKLLDLSRRTMGVTLGQSGVAMVMTSDGRVLGLPRMAGERDDDRIRREVLQPVESLAHPAVRAGVAAWQAADRPSGDILRFDAEGTDWLGSLHSYALGGETFWIGAFAPAGDFLPRWGTMAQVFAGLLSVVLVFSMLLASRIARRFSRPLEALADASARLARLDFDAGPPVRSSLAEVRQLAAAQEGLRATLADYHRTVQEQAADLKEQIAALRSTEARLDHQSHHDALTNLPNRVLFADRLGQAMLHGRREGQGIAVLMIDLDNFKTLNDTKGHETGDRLLIEVAQRLQHVLRAQDSVARLGGDEFVVLVNELGAEPVEAAAQAEMVAEKIRVALAEPYSLDGLRYHGGASIGITLLNDKNASVDDLMRQADTALYRAKAAGRNAIRFFDPAMQASLEAAASLQSDLRNAVPAGELRLYYQLQVDADHRVFGAEVLLRWAHPVRGLVSPAEFIPLAEESGLIVPIGDWVLRTACRQLKAWQNKSACRALTLAVNVSPRQFRQPDFVDNVLRIVGETGADPLRLKLELTEGIVVEDVSDTVDKMNELKSNDIHFSMDDFGTGYSSLSYLTRLPLSQLKIDQSFVRKLDADPANKAIVHTIIGMAANLDLQVIAEGVETADQREFLVAHGCRAFQGYYFSRPVPLEDFDAVRARVESRERDAATRSR